MGRVVLVTGVSRKLGGRMAALLSQEPGIDRVLGVDVVPPKVPVPGIDFVRADIRNPVIARVMGEAEAKHGRGLFAAGQGPEHLS